MQNSLSVPPKDQGDSNSPPRRGMQSKSQFRTIAPKIVPKVLTSRVLPYHSPSLCDHLNPGPSISCKPLVIPSQSYTLMQVAGQEGKFCLVALPHMASAQPIQKSRMPLPENLKLPIPRYQPPRSNKTSRKKSSPSSPETSSSKPPVQIPVCPQTSCPQPIHLELPKKTVSSEQALSQDAAPAALPDGDGLRASGLPLTPCRGDVNPPAALRSAVSQELVVDQTCTRISGTATSPSRKSSGKPSTARLAKAMTSLSPTVFGNPIQVISSVPKGKLPILPYSGMKTTEACKTEYTADSSLPGHRANYAKVSSILERFSVAIRMADKVSVGQVGRQSPCDGAFCPAPKLDPNHKTKLNSVAARRRVRKRKLPDEILTFQGKRRKCVINKCRNSKERVKTDSQEARDQKPVKKYRSIMPKPVLVMPVLACLPSPARVLQSQIPGSLEQGTVVNDPPTSKTRGGKQNDSPSAKPSFAFKNRRSGLKKPWHRCQVCNHHFEFKQHLQDHLHLHANRRPYSCRICHKTYVRSGSLSSHMKLHHGESRPKRLMCCEFCAKVFGHIRVYFGHLKEVHRVVISTESSPSDPQPSDAPKTGDPGVRGTESSLARESKSSLEEDLFLNQVDEVKLQIKCGRCQITTQSFAEIKFHLLYVHGEEIQGRLQEGVLPESKGVQEELVKHAASYWKQCPKRRKLVKRYSSQEDLHTLTKQKRQLHHHQQNNMHIQIKNEGAQLRTGEPGEKPQGPEQPTPNSILFCSLLGLHCLLCAQTLGGKEQLLRHWEQQHNCEDPSKLWTIFNAFSNQGVIEFSNEIKK